MGSSGEKNRTEGKGQGSAPDSKWVLLVWVYLFICLFFLSTLSIKSIGLDVGGTEWQLLSEQGHLWKAHKKDKVEEKERVFVQSRPLHICMLIFIHR